MIDDILSKMELSIQRLEDIFSGSGSVLSSQHQDHIDEARGLMTSAKSLIKHMRQEIIVNIEARLCQKV